MRCLGLVVLSGLVLVFTTRARADVPEQLSDTEFWNLSRDLSEPDGYFRSDNLVSDELIFDQAVPDLARSIRPGGVYLGVGPEQNFTYIAATKPKLAFILDIRRGNLQLHLMYKALFELSSDRADFISRLFNKPRPQGLTAQSTGRDILNAFWSVASSSGATYKRNLQAIDDLLTTKHGFPLTTDDRKGIEDVYFNFYWFGPSVTWSKSTLNGRGSTGEPDYRDLMIQADAAGLGLSFLASEDRFLAVKALEARNAIVPVVGDFAGPKALRAIGAFVRDHQATVSVFYVDEVEPYLVERGVWLAFCTNAATLPVTSGSVFIRPPASFTATIPVTFLPRTGPSLRPVGSSMLIPIAPEVKACGDPK